ncbi:hypothetical protein [Methylomonas sp. ZR1]|uniref:hypothetical protein n=1 Tax=Methylomonas sp. ZR1 TaxID=1797072 RepID=UPI0014928A84|nr:hypothetical protein [Methylomonas sp. ZR1]NOV28347.1 hypothetical protein [Methylomonas sp. ZR1]
MARMVKDCSRIDSGVFFDEKSYLFANYQGDIVDSRDWLVLHHGLDTVRQLYNCLPDFNVIAKIQDAYDRGFGESIELSGSEWRVSHGGRSGYRFKLHCDDLGLIVFYGSTFQHTITTNGPHLKIQCSPVFLLSRSITEIDDHLTETAKLFADQISPSGVAVHICADVQGYIPPADLDSRITTRARRVMRNSGIQSIELDAHDAAIVYGKSQSFTFGKADSLQFAVYDKGKAVKDKGELPLWLPVWVQSDQFDLDVPIWRFEARFHHSVVEQFANGSGFSAKSLKDIASHLSGLWSYALNNFRLDDSVTYINPFWQWLRDDLHFYHQRKLDIDYQRKYKSALQDGLPNDRSVSICFGQLASIYRKKRLTFSQAQQHLLHSGLWDLLCSMYIRRNKTADDILMDLADKLERRD